MIVRKNCPFCRVRLGTPDTKQHLYILPKTGKFRRLTYYCHRCGASGPVSKTMWLIGDTRKRVDPASIDLFSFKIRSEESDKLYNYLVDRGLSKGVIYKKARWSPDLPNRVIFPLWVNKKVVLINARSIDKDEEVRYITYGDKSKYIYNFDEVDDWAVLCEGVFDALSTPHGICIFGKRISTVQKDMLISKYRVIFNALDPDALKEKIALTKLLSRYMKIYNIKFKKGEDANSIGWNEMVKRIKATGGLENV